MLKWIYGSVLQRLFRHTRSVYKNTELKIGPAPGEEPAVVGHIDRISDGVLYGWCWKVDSSSRRLAVKLFWRNIFLGEAATGYFRNELLLGGYGDGCQGFRFDLPQRYRDVDLGDVHAYACWEGHMVALAGGYRASDSSSMSGIELLRPLILNLKDEFIRDGILAHPDQNVTNLMLGDNAIESNFSKHMALKLEAGDRCESYMQGHLAWYMNVYCANLRKLRAPLSGAQLKTLYRSDLFGDTFSNTDDDKAYWWAIHESRRLQIEDCLVSAAQSNKLKGTIGKYKSYPISFFMDYVNKNDPLLNIKTNNVRGRIVLYLCILILAIRSPHYLLYVPALWAHKMLRIVDGRCLFDKSIIRYFNGAAHIDSISYKNLLLFLGFDIESFSFCKASTRGDRIPITVVTPETDRCDVQLIGPVDLQIGLGESCRRVAAALKLTPFKLNIVNYDISTTNREYVNKNLLRSTINIIHLNLEEIPEAFMYVPNMSCGAVNIAFPYWELSSPADVHSLGSRLVDEIWTASHFLEDVFRGPDANTYWLGMSAIDRSSYEPFRNRANRLKYLIPEGKFLFITSSDATSWSERKNPLGVIDAFRSTFRSEEDVALIVKVHNIDRLTNDDQTSDWGKIKAICDGDQRITMINEKLSRNEYIQLLLSCDAFVSLHRAEGLGLDILDCLSLAIPVIATGYSGNTDYTREETAYNVEFDLRRVSPQEYCFVGSDHFWAEPRLKSAINAMRDVYSNPKRRLSKIEAGRSLVDTQYSNEAFSRRIKNNLDRVFRSI